MEGALRDQLQKEFDEQTHASAITAENMAEVLSHLPTVPVIIIV